MAKSARASTKKANRTNLRAKVFGPVEDARTSRLADKLMEIASKTAAEKKDLQMVDGPESATGDADNSRETDENAMDVVEPERPTRTVKSTEVRDKREKRRSLRKNRSSTTFKSKPARSSHRKR